MRVFPGKVFAFVNSTKHSTTRLVNSLQAACLEYLTHLPLLLPSCSNFGPLESVRVFPGKTFAFVNFLEAGDAIAAKAALDGQAAPAVTGTKPLAIRSGLGRGCWGAKARLRIQRLPGQALAAPAVTGAKLPPMRSGLGRASRGL